MIIEVQEVVVAGAAAVVAEEGEEEEEVEATDGDGVEAEVEVEEGEEVVVDGDGVVEGVVGTNGDVEDSRKTVEEREKDQVGLEESTTNTHTGKEFSARMIISWESLHNAWPKAGAEA